MPRLIAAAATAALTLTLVTGAAAHASEQKLPTLKVARETANVHVRPSPMGEVVAQPKEGTLLEALDLDEGWYWVILPPDEHGTRLPGWIRERDVEIVGAGEPSSVLRHFSDAVAASKARMEAEAAEQEARLEQARQRLEDARREYTAVTKKTPGAPAAPAAAAPVTAPASKQKAPGVLRAPKPRAAAGQEREWFVGYSFYRDQSDSLAFPGGWAFSLARPVRPAIDFVAGITGSHRSESAFGAEIASSTIYTFAAGPKYSRATGRVTSFAQALAGIAVTRSSAFGVSDTSTGFVLQPGFGVDIPVTKTLAARIGFDIQSVRASGGWFTGFRINTGVMFVTGVKP